MENIKKGDTLIARVMAACYGFEPRKPYEVIEVEEDKITFTNGSGESFICKYEDLNEYFKKKEPIKVINKIIYNWRQVGSVLDKDGADDDYDAYEIGFSGVIEIVEEKHYSPITYLVKFEDGRLERIFNPNKVFYNPLD